MRPLPPLLLALSLLPAASPPAAAASADDGVFRFETLNRRYQELAPDMAPVERGPLTVRLSSPRHLLDLVSNRLVLRPRPDGSYDALLELEFSGEGELVADVDVSGATSRLEDALRVPRQRRTLAARVRIERSAEGYLVTPESLPKTFDVAIESRVGAQLVAACAPLAVLGFVPVDCDDLARVFSVAAIPMPPPGETYLVEGSLLSETDRRLLDAFLARTAHRGR